MAEFSQTFLEEYQRQTVNLTAEAVVAWALSTFTVGRIALASSFSAEDQVLTQMLVGINPKARIFTLDTGRHFEETYDVWQQSVDLWNIAYEVCVPDAKEVANLVSTPGPNSFYRSIDARKACCAVRKTRPLQKIVSTVDAWIVGLRAEQSQTRSGLSCVEWDEAHSVYRISPLCNWTESQTMDYTKNHVLPMSKLYEKGFRSIGCQPCTRASGPMDDVRLGRWWWELPEHKECGLHNRPNKTHSIQ